MSDFKWRHFQGEIILQCVRWYCKYGISYSSLRSETQVLLLRQCCAVVLFVLSFFSALSAANAFIPGGGCQTYFCKDGLMMAAEYGSVLETRAGVVQLKKGKLLTFTGRIPVSIQVLVGQINVARKSSCIIQQADSGNLSVNNLQGCELTVELICDPNSKFSLMPGQELCIGDESSQLEELEPVDGVPRQLISSQIIGHKKILTYHFEANTKFAKEPLRACHPFDQRQYELPLGVVQ